MTVQPDATAGVGGDRGAHRIGPVAVPEDVEPHPGSRRDPHRVIDPLARREGREHDAAAADPAAATRAARERAGSR